jgi:polysaccharide pyruvyl transferase WcaK-like protein
LLKCALSNSQYVAVRDRHSWENLLSSRISQQIHVVPDTALGVSDLWSSDDLDASYQALFQQQRRHLPERTVVFTLKKKYAPEPPDELAKRLDRIASSLRASPLLLVLGPCHSDDEIALAVADHMTTSPLVRVPRTLREAAACIRNAQLYVGSSLHGGITAISFRTPTVLVADEEKVGFRKFSGFLAHVGLPDALCASWQTAERYINLGIPQRSSPTRLNQAFATLDEHWATLYDVLTLGTGCAKHTRLHYGPPPLLDETERCSTQRFDLGTAADHYSNGSIGTSGGN